MLWMVLLGLAGTAAAMSLVEAFDDDHDDESEDLVPEDGDDDDTGEDGADSDDPIVIDEDTTITVTSEMIDAAGEGAPSYLVTDMSDEMDLRSALTVEVDEDALEEGEYLHVVTSSASGDAYNTYEWLVVTDSPDAPEEPALNEDGEFVFADEDLQIVLRVENELPDSLPPVGTVTNYPMSMYDLGAVSTVSGIENGNLDVDEDTVPLPYTVDGTTLTYDLTEETMAASDGDVIQTAIGLQYQDYGEYVDLFNVYAEHVEDTGTTLSENPEVDTIEINVPEGYEVVELVDNNAFRYDYGYDNEYTQTTYYIIVPEGTEIDRDDFEFYAPTHDETYSHGDRMGEYGLTLDADYAQMIVVHSASGHFSYADPIYGEDGDPLLDEDGNVLYPDDAQELNGDYYYYHPDDTSAPNVILNGVEDVSQTFNLGRDFSSLTDPDAGSS